ncbi:hypothetical protein [Pseudanabaena sp. PCC 6802]|uniref:hypothetical protein n=1 Tax=Pseudanabaena sp. PCC 6802 TaxID=118173 RepID=UPI00035D1C16|nr:hypothetical protein [Pseudanabaena sp. PCC 6802]
MSINFNTEFLNWAVQIEDEAGCDVEAGLDFGQHLSDYLANNRVFISQEKLMEILEEALGAYLSRDELEIIANTTQGCARDRLKEKFQFLETA